MTVTKQHMKTKKAQNIPESILFHFGQIFIKPKTKKRTLLNTFGKYFEKENVLKHSWVILDAHR